MTGYGMAEKKDKNYNLIVEIKSLNSKYFDISPKIDDAVNIFENEIIQLIKNKCERGKIYLNIEIVKTYNKSGQVKLNDKKFNYYMSQVDLLKNKVQTKQEISLVHMMKIPGIFIESDLFNKESSKKILISTVNEAIKDLLNHRMKEGLNIENDLIGKVKVLLKKINKIEKLSKPNIRLEAKKYNKKIDKIFNNIELDKDRVYQEIAILIEKKEIDEEIIRLKSHVDLLVSLINNKSNTGKKIGFILQEIHREINTIGSKTDKLKISHLVVELKGIIEKIKEQVHNIL